MGFQYSLAGFQTDHVIEARILDLAVVDEKERSYKINDLAVPGDSRIGEKEIR